MSADSWELPDELRQIQETVARFMAAEVKPAEDKAEHDAYELAPDVLAQLQAKARAIGLWCVRSPQEYGGAGLSQLGQAVVAEEAAKCRMGAYVPACGAFGADPPNAIWSGTPEQIQRYGVPGVQQGRKIYFAISEASGGADPARAIRARAERKGDRYVLNGLSLIHI